jgi:hypothetical protein
MHVFLLACYRAAPLVCVNVAVTFFAASMLTTQVFDIPLHAPDQPANAEPLLAVAVNVTLVPGAKFRVQVEPQAMPLGLLVTGPLPLPALLMLSAKPALKVAVTAFAPSIVSRQVLELPLHAPDQPAKKEPLFGVAVNATLAPRANDAWHCDPQLMPDGALETGPLPVPDLETVSTGVLVNVAVTFLGASMTTVHAEVPEHAPDHPANTEPVFGVAVSVTVVPVPNDALQELPQAIPAGELETGPLPSPAFDTVRGWPALLNVAVTVFAKSIVTLQVAADPVQAPDHPANTEPGLAEAVSVTSVPEENSQAHVVPQLMPDGLLVTGPLPVPAFWTVRTRPPEMLNVAVTRLFPSIVTTQADVPVHAPDQPEKTEPEFGVAVNVTVTPGP